MSRSREELDLPSTPICPFLEFLCSSCKIPLLLPHLTCSVCEDFPAPLVHLLLMAFPPQPAGAILFWWEVPACSSMLLLVG